MNYAAMKIIFILIQFLILSTFSISQEFIEKSSKDPEYNSNGVPSYNLIDHNGSKQGDWFYKNYKGKTVLKKEFLDNTCSANYYKSIDDEWISIDSVMHGKQIKLKELSSKLNKIQKKEEYSEFNLKQISIIYNHEEEKIAKTLFLGEWEADEIAQAKQAINVHQSDFKNKAINKIILYVY